MFFSPLFARIKQKYTPFPVSCGIALDNPEGNVDFVRAREKLLVYSCADTGEDLLTFVTKPHLPDVICIAAPPETRKDSILAPVIRCARHEGIPVIFTETAAIHLSLGCFGSKAGEAKTILDGFTVRPTGSFSVTAVLTALTGYFYLHKEYEVVKKNVVPLLIDVHPLFSFLRCIPYGEVTTYPDVAKELGLHYNETEVMKELSRLPFGADVPGHRVVGRNGQLSDLFPGGSHVQKERLKWELVPFSEKGRVLLPEAKWSRQKYRRLTNYLTHIAPESRFLELQFAELEGITGYRLPQAARKLGSWWRNERAYAVIWQEAGWKIADVNLQQETVTFVRMTKKQ